MIATAGIRNTKVSNAVRDDQQTSRMVDRATALLTDMLGEAAAQVDARWDAVCDEQGGRYIELKLRDATGEVETRLRRADFEDEVLLRLRLSALWRKLLRIQSTLRMRELREAIERLDRLDKAVVSEG